MNVLDIASRAIVAVDRAATLEEAAHLMREHHVGALLVTRGSAGATYAAGVVTDRDLVVEAMAKGLDASAVAVGELVLKDLVAVPASCGIDEAVRAMDGAGVRRAVVRTDQGRVAGIVSMDDVLDALSEQMMGIARIVRGSIVAESTRWGTQARPEAQDIRLPAA